MAILEDLFETLFSGFSTGNIIGMINILLLIVIIGGSIFLVVWTIWKMLKYRIAAVILIKRGKDYEIDGWDRVGLFKDREGNLFARLRRRKYKIDISKYGGMIRDKKYGDLMILVKEGEQAYYQVMIPQRFYTIEGRIALPVVDHNVLRQASFELINDQRKIRKADNMMQKYGTHIAILVVVFILIIGGYILLKKEEQIIQLASELIKTAQALREDAIGQAIAG